MEQELAHAVNASSKSMDRVYGKPRTTEVAILAFSVLASSQCLPPSALPVHVHSPASPVHVRPSQCLFLPPTVHVRPPAPMHICLVSSRGSTAASSWKW